MTFLSPVAGFEIFTVTKIQVVVVWVVTLCSGVEFWRTTQTINLRSEFWAI
jgi:hypothetical protein